jgi:hypothetical protein
MLYFSNLQSELQISDSKTPSIQTNKDDTHQIQQTR